jgi:hypothetical protein
MNLENDIKTCEQSPAGAEFIRGARLRGMFTGTGTAPAFKTTPLGAEAGRLVKLWREYRAPRDEAAFLRGAGYANYAEGIEQLMDGTEKFLTPDKTYEQAFSALTLGAKNWQTPLRAIPNALDEKGQYSRARIRAPRLAWLPLLIAAILVAMFIIVWAVHLADSFKAWGQKIEMRARKQNELFRTNQAGNHRI